MAKIDVVTQSELAAVLASYNALGQTILDIRRRIEAGAAVEEGIYTADSNRDDPISGFDRALNGIGMFGLDLETKGLSSDVYDEPTAKGPELVPAPELPDWLTDTPGVFYQLEMSTEANGGVQTIDMSREEFRALKQHLAKLRGIEVPADVEAPHA